MNRSEIERVILATLVEELQVPTDTLKDMNTQTPLLGRGIGLDSVEALRLALGLESAFRISIPDADLTTELFASLGSLTEYIEGKIKSRS